MELSSEELHSFPTSLDLLEDVDFESTLIVLENSERHLQTPSPVASSLRRTSVIRRSDVEPLDLSLTTLADLFPTNDMESLSFLNDKLHSPTAITALKVKQESPDLSPVMHQFLNETWEDLSVSIPQPHIDVQYLSPVTREIKTKSQVVDLFSSTKPHAPPKTIRRVKQRIEEQCNRCAQSNNRCKSHGGGARCQMPGCGKSSQGGGLCRAHGGGKKCRVPGCTKGTQRLGLCYLHGGIRRCIEEGCKKKDRGNGYCISHGGGRRCEAEGCERSVRKGNHCQVH